MSNKVLVDEYGNEIQLFSKVFWVHKGTKSRGTSIVSLTVLGTLYSGEWWLFVSHTDREEFIKNNYEISTIDFYEDN